MRPRVRLGDGEAEPCAGDPVPSDPRPREAIEQRVLDLARDTRPGVLDGEAKPAVLSRSPSREPVRVRNAAHS